MFVEKCVVEQVRLRRSRIFGHLFFYKRLIPTGFLYKCTCAWLQSDASRNVLSAAEQRGAGYIVRFGCAQRTWALVVLGCFGWAETRLIASVHICLWSLSVAETSHSQRSRNAPSLRLRSGVGGCIIRTGLSTTILKILKSCNPVLTKMVISLTLNAPIFQINIFTKKYFIFCLDCIKTFYSFEVYLYR